MRPTIPLGPWRLAIDLAATRALTRLETCPTHGCACGVCSLWAAVHAEVLGVTLATELGRVGVAPARPAEAYALFDGPTSLGLRLTYFAVGRIMSGPAELHESPASGPGRLYHPIQDEPDAIALAVAYQHTLSAPPPWLAATPESILVIDFYVQVVRSPRVNALYLAGARPTTAV